MTSQAFITSVRIEKGGGAHEYVSVWIRGANVGTLCVREGDAERLALILRGCSCAASYLDRHGEHALACPLAGLGDRVLCQAEPRFVNAPPHAMPENLGCAILTTSDGPDGPLRDMRVPFVMKGPLSGAPRLRPPGPWSTHDHQTAEAGTGAPAPSRDDASKAGVESRPSGVPPAAGAPPTSAGTHEPGYPRTEVP